MWRLHNNGVYLGILSLYWISNVMKIATLQNTFCVLKYKEMFNLACHTSYLPERKGYDTVRDGSSVNIYFFLN